jgi:hypothetical protein
VTDRQQNTSEGFRSKVLTINVESVGGLLPQNGIIGKLFNATILLDCGGIARMSFVLEADRAIIANPSPRDLQFER